MPLVSRTRATLRSAEFGFFGVVVYTRVHTPRRWGEPFNAGVLVFSTLSSRPLRTSWLIVGMGGLDLLPALGRALGIVLWLVLSSCRVPVLPGAPARLTVRSTWSGVSPFPGPAGGWNRTRSPLATRRRHLRPQPGSSPDARPIRPHIGPTVTQAHREREQAQGTLGTADHDTRAPEAGQSRVPLSTRAVGHTARSGASGRHNTATVGLLPPGTGGAADPIPRGPEPRCER